jgi:hypothetical protein
VNRFVKIVTAISPSAALLACTTVPWKPIDQKAYLTSLNFIKPSEAQKLIGPDPLAIPPADSRELEVVKVCAGPTQLGPAVGLGSLLSLGLGALIDAAVDRIDKALQDALKNYATAYSKDQTISAYEGTVGDDLKLAYSCFRFSRGMKAADGTTKVGLDLVAQVQLSAKGDTLQMRPLRLFVGAFAVPSSNNTDKIAISLKSEAIWRTQNEGHQGTVFDTVLLKEQAPFAGSAKTVKYYLDGPPKWTDLPIIPYSDPGKSDPPVDPAKPPSYGETKITVSVAEIGVPDPLLQDVAKLFHGAKGTLEKTLAASADKTFGLPSTSGGSSSGGSSSGGSN